MDLEHKSGPMERATKAIGKITGHMVKESSPILTETFTRATGSMIRLTDTEFTFMSMGRAMRVNG